MSKEPIILHKYFSFPALGLALVMLPFSVVLCHSALIAFLFFWLFESNWIEKYAIIKNNFILQLLIAFAILQIVGVTYSEHTPEGWFSMEKKIFFFLIPIALATTSLKFNEKKIRILFYLFVGACLVGVVVCLGHAAWQTKLLMEGAKSFEGISYLDSAHFKPLNSARPTPWLFFSYIGLANGIVIHPSYFSLYLAFCIIFLFRELLTNDQLPAKFKPITSSLIFLFSIVTIFLSARIIIICLIILYISIALYWLFVKRLFIVSIGVVGLAIIICILMYVNPVSRYRNLQEISNSTFTIREKSVYSNSTEIRASLWWIGWKSYLMTNPWLGAGTGDVGHEMKQTSDRYQITNILESYDPHNQYLYILISHGIIGLVIFILFLAIPFFQAWIHRDYLYMAFIFLLTALCFTESALELQKGIAFFAILYPLLTFHGQAFKTDYSTLKYFSARI